MKNAFNLFCYQFSWPQWIYALAYIGYFLVRKHSVHTDEYMLWYGHEWIPEPLQSLPVVTQPTEWDTKIASHFILQRTCQRCEKNHNSGKWWWWQLQLGDLAEQPQVNQAVEAEHWDQPMALCDPIEEPLGPKACSLFTALGAITAPWKHFSGTTKAATISALLSSDRALSVDMSTACSKRDGHVERRSHSITSALRFAWKYELTLS